MERETNTPVRTIPAAILIAGALIAGAVLLRNPSVPVERYAPEKKEAHAAESFVLPFAFGDLGAKLVSVGVVDREKFLSLYSGTAREEARRFIDTVIDGPVVATERNAGILLNLLWAAGLGNKSRILERGEMANPRYGGADRFASTGGWTIAKEDPEGSASGGPNGAGAMPHYSRHPFALLSPEQERLVDDVSGNIFRPCCDNPAHFPDCNHGMAMLGLLEIMAAQGATEEELYETGLALNRLWFPAQYEVIEKYAVEEGLTSDGSTLLGKTFSSASGFERVSRALQGRPENRGGGGCSV